MDTLRDRGCREPGKVLPDHPWSSNLPELSDYFGPVG